MSSLCLASAFITNYFESKIKFAASSLPLNALSLSKTRQNKKQNKTKAEQIRTRAADQIRPDQMIIDKARTREKARADQGRNTTTCDPNPSPQP
jgi:hypothetical protein